MANVVSKPRRLLRRYGAISLWLTRDAVLRHGGLVAKVVGLGLTSLICQFAALGVIVGYANALEQGHSFLLFGQTWAARSSAPLLAVAAVLALFLFILSALAYYASVDGSVELRREYETFCVKRAVVLTSHLPHPATPGANRMFHDGVLSTGGHKEAKVCGRAFHTLVATLVPAGRLLLTSAALIYVNPFLSVLVLLLIGVAAFFQHRINTAAAHTTRQTEKVSPLAARARRRLSGRLLHSTAPIAYDDALLVASFAGGALRQHQRGVLGRYLLGGQARLTVEILTAVALVAVMLIVGMGILAGQWNWSVLLAYIVALRLFLSSFSRVSGSLTKLSRLYPQVQRYADFVGAAQAATQAPQTAQSPAALQLLIPSLPGHASHLILEPGQTAVLVYPQRLSRGLITLLLMHTRSDGQGFAGAYWYSGQVDCQDSTLRQCLGLPDTLTRDEANARLRELVPEWGHSATVAVELDQPLQEASLALLNGEAFHGLRLLAAGLSGRPAWVLDAEDPLLSEKYSHGLAGLRAERVLILTYKRMPQIDKIDPETALIVGDSEGLYGWCPAGWLAAHPDMLAEIAARIGRSQDSMRFAEEMGEEDDEDEEDEL